MTEQRRQHPRYAIELDAAILTGDGQTLAGRTHDLSKGGFCMLAPAAVPVGEVCRVRLALVFSENQFSEHLELPATVMWCTPIKGEHQVGLKFGPLSTQHRGYLDLFIKFLDDAGEEEDSGHDE